MVASLYRTDTPTNVTPSIHVFNTLVMVNGIARSQEKHARARGVRAFFFVDGILIILSTMFIKQHSVYDVAAAFLMFALFYIPIYRPDLLPGKLGERKLLRPLPFGNGSALSTSPSQKPAVRQAFVLRFCLLFPLGCSGRSAAPESLFFFRISRRLPCCQLNLKKCLAIL